eukprot:scaffold192_cov320-Ochromonas_danica.AAC.15
MSETNTTTSIPDSQLQALYAIYNATTGSDWRYSHGNPWHFDSDTVDPCGEDWQGVTCCLACNLTACIQEVCQLSLVAMNLAGSLPQEVGNLSFLTTLVIADNPLLSGSLPLSLGNLLSLQHLEFVVTSLTGSLPSSLGSLKQLQTLTIESSALQGIIPAEIFQLTCLTALTLQYNYLVGRISSAIGYLDQLQILNLGSNRLAGTIPAAIGQLVNLSHLDLSSNRLRGTIPSALMNDLPDLQYLGLYYNFLSGSLPGVGQAGLQLTDLLLEYNDLTGTIPSSLFFLPNLTTLSLQNNRLTGTVPDVSSSSSLMAIYLHDNGLHGTIPSSFQYLHQLKVFSLYNNIALSGTIANELARLPALQSLALSNCSFSGSLPIDLGGNSSLKILDLGFNFLTGSIKSSLYESRLLEELVLPGNWLTGQLSLQEGQWLALTYCILEYNLFYGSIPTSMGDLSYANTLSFGMNAFTGVFAVQLANMSALYMLQLQYNLFTGDMNFSPNSTNYITYFNITHNYFHGEMSRVEDMVLVEVFDVGHNLLSGTLPQVVDLLNNFYFFAQSNLLQGSIEEFFLRAVPVNTRYVDISDNQLDGSFPRHVLALDGLSTAKACRRSTLSSLLPQVHSYTLGNHAIHGSIPKCLFSMPKLRTLHLSGNGLEGSIPVEEEQELGASLSDLSLSHNQLTGSLPPPLRGGSRWVNLDVSYNKLKGGLSDNFNESAGNNNSSFIYLNINRLSGRIPGFYYDISSPGNLNMLRGNLFTCPTVNMNSHLPERDPYRMQYDCGLHPGEENVNKEQVAGSSKDKCLSPKRGQGRLTNPQKCIKKWISELKYWRADQQEIWTSRRQEGERSFDRIVAHI